MPLHRQHTRRIPIPSQHPPRKLDTLAVSVRAATTATNNSKTDMDLTLQLHLAANSEHTIKPVAHTALSKTTTSHHRVTTIHQNPKPTKTNLTLTKTRPKLPSRLLSTDLHIIRRTADRIHSLHRCHRTTLLSRSPHRVLPTCLQKRRRGGRHNKAQRNGSVSVFQDIHRVSKPANTIKQLRGTNLLIAADVESSFSLPTTCRHAGGRY